MDGWNTRFLLEWPIFRCYVSSSGCKIDRFWQGISSLQMILRLVGRSFWGEKIGLRLEGRILLRLLRSTHVAIPFAASTTPPSLATHAHHILRIVKQLSQESILAPSCFFSGKKNVFFFRFVVEKMHCMEIVLLRWTSRNMVQKRLQSPKPLGLF